MEGELITAELLTPTALSFMKRSVLQKLCKKYGLKANGKNTELQNKLKQYALNSGGSINMEDIEMIEIDRSSRQNQYNNILEPTTPQTPSVIPLEQQNKVRRSLVDDSPINIETSQHEIKEIETEMVHESKTIETSSESLAENLSSINPIGQCLSLIPYTESLVSSLAKKQGDNVTESKKEEIEDGNIQKLATDTDKMDYTLNVVEGNNTEHSVLDENTDLNPIPLNPAFEQVEINKSVVVNTPLTPSSKLIPIEPRTPPSKHIRTVETERASTNLMARLTATPDIKFRARMNSFSNYPETKAGPALDKNSPFITKETKLNFETMQNSLQIQGKESRAEITNNNDLMDICEEQLKSTDKNSPFITKETKLNFETMQNSLQIQEEESRAEITDNNDLMDICEEQLKSTETANLPLSNSENAVTESVYKELETRVAQLKALPSPERKKILGINNAKTVVTPFREASAIKQASSSSINRFAQVHEKAFSQMPSIVTHYAAQTQKTSKVDETQDEVNRKRKDLDSTQPLIKKQKLAHSIQENKVVNAAKDVYKKDEKDKVVKSVVKKTYDRNRTIKNNRSSIRLAKSKNFAPNPDEQRRKEREEFEKRKQAARSVAQPVLEKMKNQRKAKENVERKLKNLQNTQNVKIEEKKSKIPPRRT